MTVTTLDDLAEPLSVEELKASFYSALATVGVTTTTWKPGAVTRTIIAVVCVALHALSVLVANIARSGFLELASGLWLALVARYVYGVEKQYATFAAGTVHVSNSSASPYVISPGQLELAASITGKRYHNTAPVTIPAFAANVSVSVEAFEAGAASSALVGEIDTVISSFAGMSVTNNEVLVGLDDETDAAVKARGSAKLEPFSPDGPASAYDYVARNALRANGSSIGVTRTRPFVANGTVDLYCATASGALDPADVALIDDAINQQVAPLAVTANAHSAEAVSVPITYKAWCFNTTGLTETQLLQAIEDHLRAYLARVPIGGYVMPDSPGFVFAEDLAAEINQATRGGASLRIFRVILESPSADVYLAPSQFPALGAVTGTIVRIAPPRGSV